MKLTTEQKEVLKEIPGYVRKDMIARWIRYNRKGFACGDVEETPWERGYLDCLLSLETDIRHGHLNNDKDMREC